MDTLHMVWIGDPVQHKKNALMLLTSIVNDPGLTANESLKIKYWCNGDKAGALDEMIREMDSSGEDNKPHRHTEVVNVDAILEGDIENGFRLIYENFDGQVCVEKEGAVKEAAMGVKRVYDKLKTVAPVAAKDLIAQYIMWREGGLFLDTTMELVDGTALLDTLSHTDRVTTVPVLIDEIQTFPDFLQSKVSTTLEDQGIVKEWSWMNIDMYASDYGPYLHHYQNNLECWGLRATVHNRRIFSVALGRLLRFWETLFFLDPPVQGTEGDVERLKNAMTSGHDKDTRATVIGGSIIYSMYEGMKNATKKGFDIERGLPYGLEDYCWTGTKESGKVTIDALGVTKCYQGSWR
ncbi:hypothetical protein [Desulfoluna spongiiphila]|uniref:hypothetical protein n=1 Tax=Desulfoluna spongiiphila TaxID=419481 RepID=UPI0012564A2D|nr:hypothetical protein [Desulfoluna spongiiphila]VVS95087.1 hypothetical protein DBB_46640 [Desulfoluna spongiiphila]